MKINKRPKTKTVMNVLHNECVGLKRVELSHYFESFRSGHIITNLDRYNVEHIVIFMYRDWRLLFYLIQMDVAK